MEALSCLPITAKTLTDSKVGKGVNYIIKDAIFANEEVSKQALDLVNAWKDLVKIKKEKSDSDKLNQLNRANSNKLSASRNEEIIRSADHLMESEPKFTEDSNPSDDRDEALEMINEIQQKKKQEQFSLLKKRQFKQVLGSGLAGLEELEGLNGLENDNQEDQQSS